MTDQPISSIESTNEAYATRVEGLQAAHEADAEAAAEAEENSGLESVEQELPEEAKFVANPEGLRKEEDSEEAFAANQENGEDTLESTSGDTGDETEPADKGDDEPNPSWTKKEIVDYLVDSGFEVDRHELEKTNKADLLDRYTSYKS